MIFQLSRLVGWDISSFPGGNHVIQQSRSHVMSRQLGLQACHRVQEAREKILSLSHGNSQRGRDADGFCEKKGVVIRCVMCDVCAYTCVTY